MVQKGYTTQALVAQELGRTFTAAQNTQCDGLIEETEAFVDRYTGLAWLVASPVTDELHVLEGPVVYLKRTPVAAVSGASIRSPAVGASWTALVANSGFELLDPATGLLALSSAPPTDVVVGTAHEPGTLLKVTYTFTSPLPVPKEIQTATTLIVADRMLRRLDPSMAALKQISVGQGDLALTYRETDEAERPVPPLAAEILRGYRGIVFA
ncbi:MAG TPA: hypothetical protein VG370_35025 [Chloroflexota bacterium]|jgi:hypothetical protein|nr:hypothetical protein [Chloroflexota bacterium]